MSPASRTAAAARARPISLQTIAIEAGSISGRRQGSRLQASDGSQACSAHSPGAAPPLTMLARRGIPQIEVDLRRLRHQGECERPVGRWRAVGATGSWMPVPGSLDPLTSTTEELCGCLGRGSTGPSSRRAGRGPGHKTREAAPAGEPGASHKGRLGGSINNIPADGPLA